MRRVAAALAVGLIFTCQPARAQVLVYEVLGSYLDALREQAAIPGLAAAIADVNGLVWEGAYGRLDVASGTAVRADTPFHVDGLTQMFTAVMALQCAEQGRLALDQPLREQGLETDEPDATFRQLLTHTSGSPALTFELRPQRLAPLSPAVRACAVDSYRETLANLLFQLGMFDSVPGANIVSVRPPAEGVPEPEDVERYEAVLRRRATPYLVDERGRALPTSYSPSSLELSPSSGLITTVRDLAKFDMALKQNLLISVDTLAGAWSAPVGVSGLPLPHGVGWFIQTYRGEKVVWQFGTTENATSSLVVTLPARGLTLILMANSDGLVKLYSPAKGDISLSPFARVFLNLFVR